MGICLKCTLCLCKPCRQMIRLSCHQVHRLPDVLLGIHDLGRGSLPAGQLTFTQMMKMFRNELLDLNEILNYIKLAPTESAATTSAVRPLKIAIYGYERKSCLC